MTTMATDITPPQLTRRLFISRVTKGGLAIAVFGLSACGTDSATTSTAVALTTDATPPTTGAINATPATTSPPTTTGTARRAVAWERVELGNVSAFVLVRAGEAALVDTGNPGSADAIAAVIEGTGLGWSNVGHVIATHKHPDHVGSLEAVLELAPDAAIYAGAGDVAAINSPRAIQAVGDGDRVFDLEIVETPGHTPGHICVLDTAGGVLLAGDALVGQDGGVAGPPSNFTDDVPMADASVRKLATFDFETILFGHGDPVLALGSDLVREFAASI